MEQTSDAFQRATQINVIFSRFVPSEYNLVNLLIEEAKMTMKKKMR